MRSKEFTKKRDIAQIKKDLLSLKHKISQTKQLDELDILGSPCTKDCSGHRAGYEWSKQRGGISAASWSRSFNNGAELQRAGK